MFRLVSVASRILLLLAATLAPLTAAKAEWREATSEHFVVVSGGNERELVRLSQQLEAVHWMLSQLTGVTPGEDAQKVRIYLVDDLGDVHRAMGVRDAMVAGFYRPYVTGAIAVVPRNQGRFSTTILFHEYAHHFMLQYLRRVYPPWLVEGFAEFISTASFEQEGQISVGRPANHRAYELAMMQWVPLSQMFAPRSAEDEEAGVASYGQYWLAAHYLITDSGRRRQLNAFLNAYNSGTPYHEALGRFSMGLDQLDTDMRAHLRRGRFTYSMIALPPDVRTIPTVRVMREGEAALVPLELQVGRTLDDAEAARLADRLNRLAVRYPDEAAIQLLRARFAFERQDWAATTDAADRALAAQPGHGRAAVYRAWAAINGRAAQGDEVAAPDAAQLRRPIVTANRAAPNDPLPLIAYFESFALLGQTPPESAVRGLVRASELVPQDDGLRMTAVLMLLQDDSIARDQRLVVSRFLLAPLAYAPHQSPQQVYALQLLGWIDVGAEGTLPVPVDVPVAAVSVAEE